MKIVGHPVLPPPAWIDIQAEAALHGISEEEAAQKMIRQRNEIIMREESDPLRFGWEPTIWRVADAMLGLVCYDESFKRVLDKRLSMDWDEFAKAMRGLLQMERPASMLLILGGNRNAKSEYSAKRGQNVLTFKANASVYSFHMSLPRSIRDQQPLYWKYMPPEWRRQTAGENEYIKYKRKTGFSEASFINPIGSECGFLNYTQDRDTAMEGMEPDLLAPDELVPPDWLETMKYRLTTRAGKAIVTFTPIHGYTPSVKMFADSAEVVRESVAFMLPKDGGDPLPWLQLGLSESEYEELLAAEREKRVARAPQARPEDCLAWLMGQSGQPEAPAGRKFEMVPRVLKSVDPKMGVIFFHAGDNPYGNPKEVIDTARNKGPAEIRIRLYGKTDRAYSGRFPKFQKRTHIIEPDAVPETGTDYFLMDPAGDRNFFLLWIRATEDASYVRREWPGSYEIPGVGVPDPWAVPSGKKEGVNDGARGFGQKTFGFGLLRYKFEIARLEGWKDYEEWWDAEGSKVRPPEVPYPTEDELIEWDERNGARERMELRIVDSRAASNPRVENDRPVTLYEDLNNLGMEFDLAPGSLIEDGVQKINNALDYDMDAKQTYFNRPKLYVAADCKNVIFAMENWMGVDGEHGASKDPIDLLRYYYTAELSGYVKKGREQTGKGFYYGSRRARGSAIRIGTRSRPAVMDRVKVVVR